MKSLLKDNEIRWHNVAESQNRNVFPLANVHTSRESAIIKFLIDNSTGHNELSCWKACLSKDRTGNIVPIDCEVPCRLPEEADSAPSHLWCDVIGVVMPRCSTDL